MRCNHSFSSLVRLSCVHRSCGEPRPTSTEDSEMLYNDYPHTFDLTDVTGVMNICDRHMGAIAMRVSCNL